MQTADAGLESELQFGGARHAATLIASHEYGVELVEAGEREHVELMAAACGGEIELVVRYVHKL